MLVAIIATPTAKYSIKV